VKRIQRLAFFLSLIVVGLVTLVAWYGYVPSNLGDCSTPNERAEAEGQREEKVRTVRSVEWHVVGAGVAAGLIFGLVSLGLGLLDRRDRRQPEQPPEPPEPPAVPEQ
jgi:hypothetical protein